MRGSFGRNLESMLMCGSAIICMAPASHAAAQSGVMHQFDIPAQDAARALEAFGKQSGDTILFDQRRMSAKRSADVKGRFSSEGALRRLLAPTGIAPRKVGERTYVIAASAVSIPARLTVDPAQGSAAEPQSRWSRVNATGADILP